MNPEVTISLEVHDLVEDGPKDLTINVPTAILLKNTLEVLLENPVKDASK